MALRGDPDGAAAFLDLLCGKADHRRVDGAHWLGVLNESGVLGRLLPMGAHRRADAVRHVSHLHRRPAHVEAVRMLDSLERGELAESPRSRPRSSRNCRAGPRSTPRPCSTTSPRAAAATTARSAPRSRAGKADDRLDPRRPRPRAGSSSTTYCLARRHSSTTSTIPRPSSTLQTRSSPERLRLLLVSPSLTCARSTPRCGMARKRPAARAPPQGGRRARGRAGHHRARVRVSRARRRWRRCSATRPGGHAAIPVARLPRLLARLRPETTRHARLVPTPTPVVRH